MMSLRPVYGHEALRYRLASAHHADHLPASLLLTGPRGVGKQRLALWLGQLLLCEGRAPRDPLGLIEEPPQGAPMEPCGSCPQCRYSGRLQHPDLQWFFPRQKPKDGRELRQEDVLADLAESVAERVAADGLWTGSTGMEALYIETVRALLHAASLRPAMAARSVFVVGDAERMVAQEGADQAANAFLKLLEEPPPHLTLILTSSEPGALLPTIRSRVVTLRVTPVAPDAVTAFLGDPAVRARLGHSAADMPALLARANGAPGQLLQSASGDEAEETARQLLEAALAPRSAEGDAVRAQVAAKAGITRARGAYADALDALTVLLHQRIRGALDRGLDRHARQVSMAIALLERSKRHTQHNVTPQLITAVLLDELADLLARPDTRVPSQSLPARPA
jgi:DNA polymerase-3 subunit delta'